MTRDIERGVRGIESLISYSLYSVVPTLIEVALVLGILAVKFDVWFAGITLTALVLYIIFTIGVTEWRTQYRRMANEFDSAAHTKAVDSLLNYETVKYFNNERGYVRCELTPQQWRTDYRTVPFVTKPGAPLNTRASFVIESGRPILKRV